MYRLFQARLAIHSTSSRPRARRSVTICGGSGKLGAQSMLPQPLKPVPNGRSTSSPAARMRRCLQLGGQIDHVLLGVGGVAQVAVKVVGPPDAAQGPQRRHERAAGDRRVALQQLVVVPPVDDGVAQPRPVEAEAGLARHADAEAAERARADVDAVAARGHVERRPGAGVQAAGLAAETQVRAIVAPVVQVAARTGIPRCRRRAPADPGTPRAPA